MDLRAPYEIPAQFRSTESASAAATMDRIGRSIPTRCHFLLIDSRDRDTNAYPSAGSYTIHLAGVNPAGASSIGVEPYRRVVSVELKGYAFPKVDGEMYVYLSIDELDTPLDTSDTGMSKAFCLCFFDTDSLADGAVKPMRGSDFGHKIRVFSPPAASLEKLTVCWRKHGGAIVGTGDVGGVQPDHSFLLEIVTQ